MSRFVANATRQRAAKMGPSIHRLTTITFVEPFCPACTLALRDDLLLQLGHGSDQAHAIAFVIASYALAGPRPTRRTALNHAGRTMRCVAASIAFAAPSISCLAR